MKKLDEMIEKYELVVVGDKVGTSTKVKALSKNKADIEFVKANKSALIARIPELAAEKAAEKAAKEAATIHFYVHGWESHEVSVDTRENVDEQLKQIAEYYSNDFSYEMVVAAYEKATSSKVVDNETAKVEADRVAGVKVLAKKTGQKQIISQYMAECSDEQEECSQDLVTLWAMPDGTETQTQQHTW